MNKKLMGYLLCLSAVAEVHAGGIMLYEIGSDNTGLTNAGSVARAQGPATIASNAAGMSYLDGMQIGAGAQLLFGDISFDRDAATTATGSNGDNALSPTPGASFFISNQLDDHWHIGFGFYGDFGLALDYGDDWAGRYQVQNASIVGISMLPAVSYRFDDQLSVSLGVRAMYGVLETEAAINRTPFNLLDRADGQFSFEDKVWGYGVNVGVIYAPQPGTRIGLAYTSQIDLDFEDRLDIDGTGAPLARLDNTKTKLDVSVPQTLTLSLYQQIDSQWAVLATLNWQDWSEFGEIGLDVDTTAFGAQSKAIDANYDDTYQLAIGAQYQATPKWLWNFGMAYDSSAVSDSDRTVTMPMGEVWRLGTGATYQWDQNTDINVSWGLAWMGDMPADQTKELSGERLSGEYGNAWIQSVSGSATWRF